MPPIAEILATGQHYHRAGALARAEELYRQAVQADPSHAEAWLLLGQACQGLGRPAEADERYVQALYLLLLNRTGEAAGVAGWAAAVPSLGRQQVALNFQLEPEFRTDQFEGYYDALLHRPGDSAGLNSWVMSNLDVETVRVGFESTAEFFANG